MDQNSLPPLPSVEELFATSTSQSSSLPLIKNVNLFIPVRLLPPSAAASVPPKSPSLDYAEPFSPLPPQPTSPLVDRFDYQFGDSKTTSCLPQQEQNKCSGVGSSQELKSGSPASKKARYSETVEAESAMQYDSREEGEISDDDEDVDQAVTHDKHVVLSHTASHNDQSLSHRQGSTNYPQKVTEAFHSSSRHHGAHSTDVTVRGSHHRPHQIHHSSKEGSSKSSHHHWKKSNDTSMHTVKGNLLNRKQPTTHSEGHKELERSKDIPKSSSRRVLSTERIASTENAKHKSRHSFLKRSSSTLDKSSVHQHLSNDTAVTETAKLEVHSLHHCQHSLPSGKSQSMRSSKDSTQTSRRLSTNISQINKKDDYAALSQCQPSSGTESVSKGDFASSLSRSSKHHSIPFSNTLASEILKNMSRSADEQQTSAATSYIKSALQMLSHQLMDGTATHRTAAQLNEQQRSLYSGSASHYGAGDNVKDCSTNDTISQSHGIELPLPQTNAVYKSRPVASTAQIAIHHSSASLHTRPQKYMDAPYSPGSLDLDELFEPVVTSDVQAAASDDNETGKGIDTEMLHVASNTEPVGETVNMNVEDLVVEIDTADVDELHAADEVEMAAESAAIDGRGQEYEIIDDLDSNAEEMDADAAASSENSEVEFDSGKDTSLVKHVKTQQGRRNKKEDKQTLNDLELVDDIGDDAFQAPLVNNKVVLHERGRDPFDILPEGWIIVTHMSGMPIFLHKQLRVCSLSRPYFLGPGSARKHNVPVSAIPCLQYRRAIEAEATAANEPQQCSANDSLGD